MNNRRIIEKFCKDNDVEIINLAYDAKCFSCVNFIGCTEPGDIQCSKSDICLNIRIDYTILQCKKNNWFNKTMGITEP